MRGGHAFLVQQFLQRLGKFEARLARFQVPHPHAMPARRRADSGAERFGERFLGGEALGEIVRTQTVRGKAFHLGIDQDLAGETIAPAHERLLDAADLDDVGSEAEDHLAASTIKRFISRTASRIPTNSARLTMAWPMCSSRRPGRRATGCTLK